MRAWSVPLVIVLLSFVATAPAWIVPHPPLQDLPDHLAALRVIHDYSTPGLGFEENFVLQVHKTAYLLYYLAGSALAAVFDVRAANILLMCFYLGGTPLALRQLLLALGKDERLTLLSIPFLVSTMFMYGLLPFVFGIPLMLFAMAAGVQYLEENALGRGLGLTVLTVALFFAHVFPFGCFGLFYAFMFPWAKPRKWLQASLPTLPSLMCVFWWTFLTSAGGKAQTNLGRLHPLPLRTSLANVWTYTGNIFRDHSDEAWTAATLLIVVVSFWLSRRSSQSPGRLDRPYALFVLLLVALYFLVGERLGGIYLFAQRFPSIFLFCAIPLLRIPRGKAGQWIFGALAVAAIGSVTNVCKHFVDFEEKEVGEFDAALAAMDPGKKVCGLIFDKHSKVTYRAPFVHFVAYYQAEKGGVTVFTFSEHSHWPFRFRKEKRPTRGIKANWEWRPKTIPLSDIFPFYDYVLTRGEGFFPPREAYHLHWQEGPWHVWKRATTEPSPD